MQGEWYEVERQSKMTGGWYAKRPWTDLLGPPEKHSSAVEAKDVADRIRRYDGQVRIVHVTPRGREVVDG